VTFQHSQHSRDGVLCDGEQNTLRDHGQVWGPRSSLGDSPFGSSGLRVPQLRSIAIRRACGVPTGTTPCPTITITGASWRLPGGLRVSRAGIPADVGTTDLYSVQP
jgi:hypothetical protein